LKVQDYNFPEERSKRYSRNIPIVWSIRKFSWRWN